MTVGESLLTSALSTHHHQQQYYKCSIFHVMAYLCYVLMCVVKLCEVDLADPVHFHVV